MVDQSKRASACRNPKLRNLPTTTTTTTTTIFNNGPPQRTLRPSVRIYSSYSTCSKFLVPNNVLEKQRAYQVCCSFLPFPPFFHGLFNSELAPSYHAEGCSWPSLHWSVSVGFVVAVHQPRVGVYGAMFTAGMVGTTYAIVSMVTVCLFAFLRAQTLTIFTGKQARVDT